MALSKAATSTWRLCRADHTSPCQPTPAHATLTWPAPAVLPLPTQAPWLCYTARGCAADCNGPPRTPPHPHPTPFAPHHTTPHPPIHPHRCHHCRHRLVAPGTWHSKPTRSTAGRPRTRAWQASRPGTGTHGRFSCCFGTETVDGSRSHSPCAKVRSDARATVTVAAGWQQVAMLEHSPQKNSAAALVCLARSPGIARARTRARVCSTGLTPLL